MANDKVFLFHCSCRVDILDGYFYIAPNQPSGWTHVVLNYIGPKNRQGIQIYYDGVQTKNDEVKFAWDIPTGDGRVVVGRRTTSLEQDYTGVDVDELMFFNKKLSDQEIMDIKNIV